MGTTTKTPRYYVKAVSKDETGHVAGAGFVIMERGDPRAFFAKRRVDHRTDWPMLETRQEAERDIRGFLKADRELAADEASERAGLRYMGAEQ